jgi:hypothetical protein
MSPILGARGGLSARAYGLFSLQSTNSYESISTVTVGSGGTPTISFSSIPSTYKHLQIRGIAKYLNTAGGSLRMQFNSDTGSNYAYHYISGDGASPSADAGTSSNFINVNIGQQDTAQFSTSVIDILDYANTSKYKISRILSGLDKNGSGSIQFNSGAWFSTFAITSITLTPQSNTTPTNQFEQHSSFALYGIKG